MDVKLSERIREQRHLITLSGRTRAGYRERHGLKGLEMYDADKAELTRMEIEAGMRDKHGSIIQ